MEISGFEAGQPARQGVRWSADRAQAWQMQDGKKVRSISLEEAAQIVERIAGCRVPVP